MKKLVNSGFGKLLKISLKRFTDNILKDVFSVTQTDINEFSSNLQDRYNNVDRQICTHARTHIHMLACTCVHTHTSYWRRFALSECFFQFCYVLFLNKLLFTPKLQVTHNFHAQELQTKIRVLLQISQRSKISLDTRKEKSGKS